MVSCECGEIIQFVAVFFCAMNAINAGLEYGWTSAAFPVLLNPRGNATEALVTSEEGVWIATLALPGAIVGALINALLCDIVGRKPFIMFTCLPYTIQWILISIANAAYVYYIARFLGGVASGMVLAAVPMYTGEISSPRLRGRLCAVPAMCVVLGIFFINLLNLFVTIEVSALILLLFPITSFVGLLFMPESPYFYIMKNKEAKALKSLQIFRGKEDVGTDLERMKETIREQNETKKEGFKALVTIKVNRDSLMIVIILRSAQPLCGITTLVYYSSVILGESGSSFPVKYSTMVFAFALMVSVLIGLLIVDHSGRRPLILISLVGSFFGLVILGVFFHLKVSDVDLSSYTFIPLTAIVITVAFFGIGLQVIPYVLQSELFKTGVKATAVAIGLIVFSLFSLICSKYFQYMKDIKQAHISIYTFAFFTVATFFYALFKMPETKGVSLEEVQVMMTQGKIHFRDVDTSSQ